MRGKTTLQIIRRILTKSRRYKDQYEIIDQLVLLSGKDELGRELFKVISIKRRFKPQLISRHEISFVYALFKYYKSGDYCIKFWSKGKRHGLKLFWDGIIAPDRKFYRRKLKKDNVGNYMKTKPAGKWYNL